MLLPRCRVHTLAASLFTIGLLSVLTACSGDDELPAIEIVEETDAAQQMSLLRCRERGLPDPPNPAFLENCDSSSFEPFFTMLLQDTIVSGVASARVLYDEPQLRPYISLVIQAAECYISAAVSFIQLPVDLGTAAGPRVAINPGGRCQESFGHQAADPEPDVVRSGRASFEYLDHDVSLAHYIPDTTTGYVPVMVIDSYNPVDSLYRGRFVGRFIRDKLCVWDVPGEPDTVVIEEGWFKTDLIRR